MRCSLLLVVLLLGHGAALNAETTRETAARLGVDVVLLHGGREARGSIVRRGEDGALTIAVRRGWLQTRQPEWLAELDQTAADGRQAAHESLVTRIKGWLAERSDEPKLALVLRMELERIEQAAAKGPVVAEAPADSEFLLIEIARCGGCMCHPRNGSSWRSSRGISSSRMWRRRPSTDSAMRWSGGRLTGGGGGLICRGA